MSLTQGFYVFMTALFTALIMVPFLCRWGVDTGTVDVPDERKVHGRAIPRAGGIAIGTAFLFSLLMYVELGRELRGILAGGLILFFTGLADDFYGLSAKKKFAGEIAACLTAMAVGKLLIRNLGDIFGLGPVVLPLWLAIPFTVFAVVGVINAINLIDGLDGLAGGVSVIALATFAVHGFLAGNAAVSVVCVALIGAVTGFLKYNIYPARIFMGDAGSLGVGFVTAFLAISLTQAPAAPVHPAIPLLILGVPIMDTVWVMSQRILAKRNPFLPDMNHIHHKFLNLGVQHRFTVVIIYQICFFWAIFSVIFRNRPQVILLASFIVLSFFFYAVLRYAAGNRDRFSILGKDSSRSIRDTTIYRRLADLIARMTPALTAFILLYFILAATSGQESSPSLQRIGAILVLACALLLHITRDTRNHFVLGMFYFSGMLITFMVEQQSNANLFLGANPAIIANILYAAITLVVVLRVCIRRPGEFFLSSIDFLILGTTVLLLILSRMNGPDYGALVMAKGIVLYMGLKVVTLWGPAPTKIVLYAMLAVQSILVVRGFCCM